MFSKKAGKLIGAFAGMATGTVGGILVGAGTLLE